MSNKTEKSDEHSSARSSRRSKYYVMRQAGTERAFTGAYWDDHAEGTYSCAALWPPAFQLEYKIRFGNGLAQFSTRRLTKRMSQRKQICEESQF